MNLHGGRSGLLKKFQKKGFSTLIIAVSLLVIVIVAAGATFVVAQTGGIIGPKALSSSSSVSVTITLTSDKFATDNLSSSDYFLVNYISGGISHSARYIGKPLTLSVNPSSSITIAGKDTIGNIVGMFVLNRFSAATNVQAPPSGSLSVSFVYYEYLIEAGAYAVNGTGSGYSNPMMKFYVPPTVSGNVDSPSILQKSITPYSQETVFRMLNSNWTISSEIKNSNNQCAILETPSSGTNVYLLPTIFEYQQSSC